MTQAQTKGQEASKDEETAKGQESTKDQKPTKEQTLQLQQHHEKAATNRQPSITRKLSSITNPATTKLQHTTPMLPMGIVKKRENKRWKLARNTR